MAKSSIVPTEIRNPSRPVRSLVAIPTEPPRAPYMITLLRTSQTSYIKEYQKTVYCHSKLKVKVIILIVITALDFLARNKPAFSVFAQIKTASAKTAINVKQWTVETATVRMEEACL